MALNLVLRLKMKQKACFKKCLICGAERTRMYSIAILPLMSGKDYPSAGADLYDVLVQRMNVEDKINLDLKDVPVLPSMFLNMSLGRIIQENGVDYLKSKIVFSNIKSSDITRLKDYIARFE